MADEKLTREAFAESLNTKFRIPVRAEDSTEAVSAVEIELVEVNDNGRAGETERFSLIFRGADDFFLPQRTYPVEHERLGAFHLFLVPVGREPDGFRYEAIFNRFVPSQGD